MCAKQLPDFIFNLPYEHWIFIRILSHKTESCFAHVHYEDSSGFNKNQFFSVTPGTVRVSAKLMQI